MDIPADTLKRVTKPKPNAPRNEREELLSKFLERLNHARPKAGYKPMTYGQLARLMTGVPTKDLWPFYKTCDQARSFGAMFWHRIKPRRTGKNAMMRLAEAADS